MKLSVIQIAFYLCTFSFIIHYNYFNTRKPYSVIRNNNSSHVLRDESYNTIITNQVMRSLNISIIKLLFLK